MPPQTAAAAGAGGGKRPLRLARGEANGRCSWRGRRQTAAAAGAGGGKRPLRLAREEARTAAVEPAGRRAAAGGTVGDRGQRGGQESSRLPQSCWADLTPPQRSVSLPPSENSSPSPLTHHLQYRQPTVLNQSRPSQERDKQPSINKSAIELPSAGQTRWKERDRPGQAGQVSDTRPRDQRR